MYEAAVRPIVEDVLEGYNGTIMAYGQVREPSAGLYLAGPVAWLFYLCLLSVIAAFGRYKAEAFLPTERLPSLIPKL